jgi:CDP-glycerol glycerophosphotransferase (TagB/SpsB family)
MADVRKLEQLRGLPTKELAKVGIPYMDTMVERLKEVGSAPEHPRTVLLAPSWGQSAILQVYGGKIIDVLLKTGYHVIIRPHPQSFASEKEMLDSLMQQYPQSDQLEWNRDTDNFEVLRRSDILISDFSGVIFDFSLVYDKPIIYTDPNFDLSLYDAWWLDTPMWTLSALPRLGCQLTEENMENLKGLIDTCLSDNRFAQGRHEVLAETWAHYGDGANQVATYLCNKYDELTHTEKGE